MDSKKRIFHNPEKEHELDMLHDAHENEVEKFCMLDFYSNLKQKTMVKLKAKNQDILRNNSGCAFVYFEKTEEIHEFEHFLKTKS